MSEIRATTISDTAGTGPITLTGQSAAKAWVNVGNAGTTLDINTSFNVSSANDNGTGDFSYSLTSSFASLHFSQQSTYRGAAFDKIASMNSGRVTASLMATEISDPHAQALQDHNHVLTAHGDLA